MQDKKVALVVSNSKQNSKWNEFMLWIRRDAMGRNQWSEQSRRMQVPWQKKVGEGREWRGLRCLCLPF